MWFAVSLPIALAAFTPRGKQSGTEGDSGASGALPDGVIEQLESMGVQQEYSR
jgi:hypothetical protein